MSESGLRFTPRLPAQPALDMNGMDKNEGVIVSRDVTTVKHVLKGSGLGFTTQFGTPKVCLRMSWAE